jgi:putative phosphoesterase
MARSQTRLGIVSDTHDRVDTALAKLFAGVDCILHAGDITGPEVLEQLRAIAPVRAVRGNNDIGPWADALPAARVERFADVPILMVHILGTVDEPTNSVRFLLEAEKPKVVISGHSHQGLIRLEAGVVYFNPGSAGPPRFKLKPAAGILTLEDGKLTAQLFALEFGNARLLETVTV